MRRMSFCPDLYDKNVSTEDDLDSQNVHIQQIPTRKTEKIDKSYSRLYYVNVNGCDVNVCKQFFLATFDGCSSHSAS